MFHFINEPAGIFDRTLVGWPPPNTPRWVPWGMTRESRKQQATLAKMSLFGLRLYWTDKLAGTDPIGPLATAICLKEQIYSGFITFSNVLFNLLYKR
jgi:hypothetical protein